MSCVRYQVNEETQDFVTLCVLVTLWFKLLSNVLNVQVCDATKS